jgi:NADPH:quinone reductase
MKAMCIQQYGGPEVIQLQDLAIPVPQTGDVLIRVKSAGLNFIDIYQRTGLYKNPLPFVLGNEAAGVVQAVGDGVQEFSAGDRVAFAMHLGAFAEYVCVPAAKVVAIPDSIDFATAAAVMLQGMTAHYLTHHTFPLQPGHTALVHAAAGGTGQLLVQMAKLRGASIVATVSTAAKADIARQAGADHVINYAEQDFSERLRELGIRVDVIYDSVGQATFERGLSCLKPRGYMVLFGQSSGPVAPFNPAVLAASGSVYLTRPSLAHYIADRSELEQRARDTFTWIEEDVLHVTIAAQFPLTETAQAEDALVSRRISGKIVLTVAE